jgi:hypothetical protein
MNTHAKVVKWVSKHNCTSELNCLGDIVKLNFSNKLAVVGLEPCRINNCCS